MKKNDTNNTNISEQSGFGTADMKLRKMRSLILALFLFSMVVLFFFVTLAKLGFWL